MRKYKTRPVGRSPVSKSVVISKSMKSNRSSGTKPELVLSRLLRKKLHRNVLPGKPDFVYTEKKVAVFVHGCFWHRCPKCKPSLPKTNRSFWKGKFERNLERDKLNVMELERMGWRVVVVWEHEIKKSPEKSVDRIKSFLC